MRIWTSILIAVKQSSVELDHARKLIRHELMMMTPTKTYYCDNSLMIARLRDRPRSDSTIFFSLDRRKSRSLFSLISSVAEYSDFGPIECYISETAQYKYYEIS